MFGLAGPSLGNALTQLSGENATGAQQGAFQLGNSYLSLLTDPFATNRVGANGAIGFAPGVLCSAGIGTLGLCRLHQSAACGLCAALGHLGRGVRRSQPDARRGGCRQQRYYTRAGGVAAGADYRISPNALIGVSLAGGNINWTLTGNGVTGGGNSDTFLAGLYGKYSAGQAYVSGALTYSSYWATTNRTVTVAGLDQLRAEYNAHGFGGRIEGGYRLPVAYGNIYWTPYGAVQGQSFSTPGYGETAAAGPNLNQFALNFAGRTATAFAANSACATTRGDRQWQPAQFVRPLRLRPRQISNPARRGQFHRARSRGGPVHRLRRAALARSRTDVSRCESGGSPRGLLPRQVRRRVRRSLADLHGDGTPALYLVMVVSPGSRHARACPGHPRLRF